MGNIPGFDDTNVEIYVNNNKELKATCDSQCVHFGELNPEILGKLSTSMMADTVAVESLHNDLHIYDSMDMLEKYHRCCSPIIDETPDLNTTTGEVRKEIWDCPERSSCPANGKICKAVSGPNGSLTPQETKIYFLTCKGLLDKEIADCLGCSINTVDTHQKRIKNKLGLNNRVEYLLSIQRPQQFNQYEHKK